MIRIEDGEMLWRITCDACETESIVAWGRTSWMAYQDIKRIGWDTESSKDYCRECVRKGLNDVGRRAAPKSHAARSR